MINRTDRIAIVLFCVAILGFIIAGPLVFGKQPGFNVIVTEDADGMTITLAEPAKQLVPVERSK